VYNFESVKNMKRKAKRGTRRKRTPPSEGGLKLFVVPGLPEIQEGDDLPGKIGEAARRAKLIFRNGDVIVVAQKIVSKAEGCIECLSTVKPSAKAQKLAATLKKDPRFIEVVLRESKRIVRTSERVLIVETHHGLVCANAGVDHSNVPGSNLVTVLPVDPDKSARRLAQSLRRRTRKRIAVIISDTFGRPWRLGLTNVAIGASGVPAMLDLRGKRDRAGKPLHATILAVADELAAAAGLLMGKASGTPVVVIRGYRYRQVEESAVRIIRPAKEDLFR
jgi:coenzyme F420-0:L-glutamate ligase/coenzyme F420-1:gamma-L-glutamate ligase